jgi:23S rRNA (cytosine1962-C5)-methyltransferase
MRNVKLSKSGYNKLKSYSTELKVSDLEDSVKSFLPGEWVIYFYEHEFFSGFINPMIDEKFPVGQVLSQISKNDSLSFSPEVFISNKIVKALNRRKVFNGYDQGSRLFYGIKDGLPGLIVDAFQNICLIQINSAGVDRYRDEIKCELEKLLDKPCVLFDNKKYREKENLPIYESELSEDIKVMENELRYFLKKEVVQKIGFYYDHRENRRNLQRLIHDLNLPLSQGVDLFCYAGAWGINALNAGVKHMDFVDQGDFDGTVMTNLKLNNFEGRGKFFRDNVFKFLDEAAQNNIKYDLILSDPPAFTKSISQKKEAIEGYQKLHRKVFKIASRGSICCFSSCTHYVDHHEFIQTIVDAGKKENKSIQLLYSGIQGWDHAISTLDEKASYIKSYFYYVE